MSSKMQFCDWRKLVSERSDMLVPCPRNGQTHSTLDCQIREVDEWEKHIKGGGKYFFTR